MSQLWEQIHEAADIVRRLWPQTPRAGIILGTGLGSLAQQIQEPVRIEYGSVPHFPEATAISHTGQLVCGLLEGLPVVAMEGRYHLYEGYSPQQVTFPVRVLRALGAELLVVSNACGGMNPDYRSGEIMLIDDHINLLGVNPLFGPNDERLGQRFPDMSQPYDFQLCERAQEVARREKIKLHRGVYVAVPGPNLETRAEYRFLRTIGADVVGMSTVPEVIVAVHAGMRVLGLSIITDMCLPDALEPANIESILAHAAAAEPNLRKLVLGILREELRAV